METSLSLFLPCASTLEAGLFLYNEFETPDSSPRQEPLDAIRIPIHSGKGVFSVEQDPLSSLPCSRSLGSTTYVVPHTCPNVGNRLQEW